MEIVSNKAATELLLGNVIASGKTYISQSRFMSEISTIKATLKTASNVV